MLIADKMPQNAAHWCLKSVRKKVKNGFITATSLNAAVFTVCYVFLKGLGQSRTDQFFS